MYKTAYRLQDENKRGTDSVNPTAVWLSPTGAQLRKTSANSERVRFPRSTLTHAGTTLPEFVAWQQPAIIFNHFRARRRHLSAWLAASQ